MCPTASAPLPAAAGNLRRVFLLRNIQIAVVLLALGLAHRVLALPLPLPALGAVLGAWALLNLVTAWRLSRPWPVAEGEFFAHLLADVAAVTFLLYFAGGATNPLVSLYLLPLVITAIALPPPYTWAMASLTASCYTLLMFAFHPLLPRDGDFHTAAYLHLTGMWLTFVVSAFLIAYFVVRMAQAVQERDRQIAAAREETLRNERIVALGTLAAGAAHELGTPLSTLAVVTRELERDHGSDPALVEDLRLLRAQVDTCKEILSNLLASAGQGRGEDARGVALGDYFDGLLDKWRLLRPGVAVAAQWRGERPGPRIMADQTLTQALLNLLNNAADASPGGVEVLGGAEGGEAHLEIRDRGPGLSPEAAQRAGEPFFTTKGGGIGIGLFLANATLERFGGKVVLLDREGGGTVTEVRLPLEKLLIS